MEKKNLAKAAFAALLLASTLPVSTQAAESESQGTFLASNCASRAEGCGACSAASNPSNPNSANPYRSHPVSSYETVDHSNYNNPYEDPTQQYNKRMNQNNPNDYRNTNPNAHPGSTYQHGSNPYQANPNINFDSTNRR